MKAPAGAFVDYHTGGWERFSLNLTDEDLERVLDASDRVAEQAVVEQIVDEYTAHGIEYVEGTPIYQFHFRQIQFTGRRKP